MTSQLKSAAAKKDRRVTRTRTRLAVALRELIQHKPLRAITVQDVLNHAGVSRSTFYAHFAGTEDLFLTDIDEFLERMANCLSEVGERSERLAAVRELFAHVGASENMRQALARSERLSEFFELAGDHFARGVERRLSEIARSRTLPKAARETLAHAISGALIAQLRWWMSRRTRIAPEEMDRAFHQFAWSGIAARAQKEAGLHGKPDRTTRGDTLLRMASARRR